MDLTLNLGNNREEFIEKLATYRYYALNEDLIKGKEVEKFFKFIRDMSADDMSKEHKKYNYDIQEDEIEDKLEEIKAREQVKAREQAGGGKKSRKKSRKHKKRKSKKSRKHRRKTKSHYRR